jgi:hypothetical protein
MPTRTVIRIAPDLEELAKAFESRMQSPLVEELAKTEAEFSVIANVRMAFDWKQQYPIPAGTSAERAVILILERASGDVALASTELEGEVALPLPRADAVTDSSGRLNPILLLEEDNLYGAALYRYEPGALPELVPAGFAAQFPDAVVFTFRSESE